MKINHYDWGNISKKTFEEYLDCEYVKRISIKTDNIKTDNINMVLRDFEINEYITKFHDEYSLISQYTNVLLVPAQHDQELLILFMLDHSEDIIEIVDLD